MVSPHISKTDVVCDIGCGPHAQLLKELSPEISHGFGLDRDQNNQTKNNLTMRQCDIEGPLPLQDNSVDVITMLAVLEHVENDKELLKECHRILRPGGRLLITVPTIWNKPVGEFLAYRLHLLEEEEYRDHKRYYTKKALEEDVSLSGFRVSESKYWELKMNLFVKAVK